MTVFEPGSFCLEGLLFPLSLALPQLLHFGQSLQHIVIDSGLVSAPGIPHVQVLMAPLSRNVLFVVLSNAFTQKLELIPFSPIMILEFVCVLLGSCLELVLRP
jgi:hypothetical protein